MRILKELTELVENGIITDEVAEHVREYYQNRGSIHNNRLFIAFGILGAILSGLGVILIFAHNWDDFPRSLKTFLAFLPLLASQWLCLYVILRKNDDVTWKESGAALVFFSVGAAIALISQIYHIPGNLSTYLLTWMILCIPVIYVMRSSITSLLCLAGTTYYAVNEGYWAYPSSLPWPYWLLLLSIIPHYYQLYRNKPQGNFMAFHNWLVPLSMTVSLGTTTGDWEELMFVAYVSMFGAFYLIGQLPFIKQQRMLNNGYAVIGSLGTIVLFLSLSFDWFWETLRTSNLLHENFFASPEFMAVTLLSLLAAVLFYFHTKGIAITEIKPFSPAFMLFIILFFVGAASTAAVIIINIYMLVGGIRTVREGALNDHLPTMNFGLLIIAALVLCRFFDTDMTFVARGLLFLSVGTGFFVTNYQMLKKRKAHEK
jgi:uncharacterized membrane protein